MTPPRPWRDDQGVTAIIVGILVVVLVGMAAFVADFGVAYVNKRQVSTAVDSAALAAANSLAQLEGDCAAIVAAGEGDAKAAAGEHIDGSLKTIDGASEVPGTWDITCDPGGTYGEVTLDAQADVPTFFAGVFGGNVDSVRRSATARFGTVAGPAGLRPYAVCAADAIALRDAFLDNDPSNDVLIVKLQNQTGGGNGAPLPQTANARNTNTSLSVSPVTGVTTQTQVTLSATVREQGSGNDPIPGVAVAFNDDTLGLVAAANTDANGVATIATTLPAGALNLRAVFVPPNADVYNGSQSSLVSVTVTPAGTPTTAPPTTEPPTTAPPTTEPPLETGPCGTQPGNFAQLNFSAFPTDDECEDAFNQNSFIFACYIRDGYQEQVLLPATIAGDTGNDCDNQCEEAWATLQNRQIALPVYTTVESPGNNASYTAPYVIGVQVCGYWFGSNTSWHSTTCGKDWSTVTPEPKNVDTIFQFGFTRLVVSGSVGGSSCRLGDECDLLRGVALVPGPRS